MDESQNPDIVSAEDGEASAAAHHDHDHDHGHHDEPFLRKYFWSCDHKVICLQYMYTGMIMAAIGGFMAYAFRMQLAYPGESVPLDAPHPAP